MPLREALCEPDNLVRAWRRYRHHRGAWSATVPMSTVRRDPLGHVLRLADDLRRGRYRPASPLLLPLRKADGGTRTIAIYPLRDRIAQRAALQLLQGRVDADMSPCSFGFRPGLGVAHALAAARAALARGCWWAVDADIERCFDNLPRQQLLQQAERRLQDDEAPRLVAEVMGWASPQARAQAGVPQGACLAPWLCNLLLWQLDDEAAARGWSWVRYADDLMILMATRRSAEGAHAQLQTLLERLQLRLHPEKTRIACATSPLRFLGSSLQVTLALPAPAAPVAGASCC